jgi:hypothetical protein
VKKSYLVIVVLILVGLAFWLGLKPNSELPVSATLTTGTNQVETNVVVKANGMGPSNNLPPIKSTIPAYRMEYIQKITEDPQYDWKQPINFYGRVVDESNVPVADVSIHFTWNDISEKGTSDADTKSDGNGFFSLTDRKGKRLYVDVSKEGYYSSGDARGAAFEYANPNDGLFKPDSMNPVVFHLRKKGVGVDLITSQYGVKSYFGVNCPLNGTVQIDLLERKTGQGQLEVSQIKPTFENWKRADSWSFKMEIPSGGFVEENDEFPFEAPESGYQSAVEFQFQKANADWTTDIKKDYYIKFGNPPIYGRLHLETSIVMEGARLTYTINPTGSRNLEPK